MQTRWHISASLASLLVWKSDCLAEDPSNLELFVNGGSSAADLAELAGTGSDKFKLVGKSLGSLGYITGIADANDNLGRKWNTDEDVTSNDFLPYFLPLAALNPISAAVVTGATLGYVGYHVYQRAIKPTFFPDSDETLEAWNAWKAEENGKTDRRRNSYFDAMESELKRLAKSPPKCGSMEWTETVGEGDGCMGEDSSIPFGNGESGRWRVESIIISTAHGTTTDNGDATCYDVQNDLEVWASLYANRQQREGCTVGSVKTQSNSAMFDYECQYGDGASSSGTFNISYLNGKVRVLNLGTSSRLGGKLDAETFYVPCGG